MSRPKISKTWSYSVYDTGTMVPQPKTSQDKGKLWTTSFLKIIANLIMLSVYNDSEMLGKHNDAQQCAH